MRMLMRRFTRSTNGFSKKIEIHAAAVAIHLMQYNFVRIRETLRVDFGDGIGRCGSAMVNRRHHWSAQPGFIRTMYSSGMEIS